MTLKEKSKRIEEWCGNRANCDSTCPLSCEQGLGNPTCFSIFTKEHEPWIEKNYEVLFGSTANPVNDPVNHPSHYNKGKIEVWDFIGDWKLNFDRGNAIKYICRAGSKDPNKEIQDLEKAIWYINREIKILKGETNNGTEKESWARQGPRCTFYR
jgi:hypothetical protein